MHNCFDAAPWRVMGAARCHPACWELDVAHDVRWRKNSDNYFARAVGERGNGGGIRKLAGGGSCANATPLSELFCHPFQ
jgi:hypothetical protein